MRDIRQKVGGEEEEERLSKLKYSVLGCMELPATTKKTDKISSDVQEGQECWWVTACCRSFLDWRDVSCLSQVTENIISRQTLQGEHQIIYIQSCNTDYWLTPGFPSGSGLCSQSCTDFIFTFFYTSFTFFYTLFLLSFTFIFTFLLQKQEPYHMVTTRQGQSLWHRDLQHTLHSAAYKVSHVCFREGFGFVSGTVVWVEQTT